VKLRVSIVDISEFAKKPVNTSESWPALSIEREMKDKSLAFISNKFVSVFGCHLIH
jgi:hypothetical protein